MIWHESHIIGLEVVKFWSISSGNSLKIACFNVLFFKSLDTSPWKTPPGSPSAKLHPESWPHERSDLSKNGWRHKEWSMADEGLLGIILSSLKKGLVEVRLSINETLKIRVKFFDEFQLTTFPDIFRNIWFIRIDVWHRNLPQKLGMNIFHTPSAEMAFGAI